MGKQTWAHKMPLISEEDARYLLHSPFSDSKKYPTYEAYHRATLAEVDAWARKQAQALVRASRAWDTVISMLKQACREFCAKVEPGFEPFLQEVLLIASKNWAAFPPWNSLFAFSRDYDYPKYISRRDRGLLDIRVGILQHPREWIEKLILSFYELWKAIPRSGKGIFIRDLSDEEGMEYAWKVYQAVASKDLHVEALHEQAAWFYPRLEIGRGNLDVLKKTPFYSLVQTRLAFDIPLDARMAHIDICAGSGHGKTWLLQSFITDTLNQGYGFLVMDSQGALIPKILELKPLLQKEVIYINPEDKEYIPGITFFGVNLEGVEDKDKAFNTLISFYESIFNDLMGSGLTEKQGFMFGYVSQLLLTIPKATIFTFIDVLTNGDKYMKYMQGLPSTARYFFENHFFQKTYDHTKQEIARKLLGLVKTSTVDRILNNTEQRIDFHKAMNEGAIILINTSKDYLQATLSSFFGKFLLGMIYTNVVKRDPDGRDPPFFFFIDEAQEYFLKSMGDMFSQFRKFNVGLCIAHQNLEQLKKKGIDADVRASTAVKIVGSPDKEDAHVFAAEMRVPIDFLNQCKKYKSEGYSEWACFVRHEMDKAVKITAPWFVMDKLPKMTKDEQRAMVERNRQKYCVKVESGKPAGDEAVDIPPKDPPDPPKQTGSGRAPDAGGRDDSVWD